MELDKHFGLHNLSKKSLTNKDRLCEQREPQSYPVLDKPEIEVDAL